jgi:hypothetical protein
MQRVGEVAEALIGRDAGKEFSRRADMHDWIPTQGPE